MKSALLRAQVESALAGRVPSPFTFREAEVVETVPTGVAAIDSLTRPGGLPRGALTEITGADSSGRTSLLLAIFAALTRRGEVTALVDASDALDPHSAPAAGVDLRRLLWVRCTNLEQTLKATDLLLAGGGFGLVAVDLGDVAPELGRRVPLASWFRFRRLVEHTPTVLVFLEPEPYAKSCASLVLRLEASTVRWKSGVRGSGFGVRKEAVKAEFENRNSKIENRKSEIESPKSRIKTGNGQLAVRRRPGRSSMSPHALLLRGVRSNVEVVRSRLGSSKFEARNSKIEIRN